MDIKVRIHILEVVSVLIGFSLVYLFLYVLGSFSPAELKTSAVILVVVIIFIVTPLQIYFKQKWLRPFLELPFSELGLEKKIIAIVAAQRYPYLSFFSSLAGWYLTGIATAFFIWLLSAFGLLKNGIFFSAVAVAGTTTCLYQFYLIKQSIQAVLERWLKSAAAFLEDDPAFFTIGIRAKFLISFSLFVGIFLLFSALCLFSLSHDITRSNFHQLAKNELYRIAAHLEKVRPGNLEGEYFIEHYLATSKVGEVAWLGIVDARGRVIGRRLRERSHLPADSVTLRVPLSQRDRYLEGVFAPKIFSMNSAQEAFRLCVLVVGILLLTVACAFLVAQDVAKPITLLRRTIESVAKGDFRYTPLPLTEDEVGILSDGLGEMLMDLRLQTRRLESTCRKMQDAAQEMFSSVKDISRRSESQLVLIEKGIKAVEEVNKTVEDTTNNARILSDAGENISKYTGDLKVKINEVSPRADLLFQVIEVGVESVRKLNQEVENLAQSAAGLVAESGRVMNRMSSIQQMAKRVKTQAREAVSSTQVISEVGGKVFKTVQGAGEAMTLIKGLADFDSDRVSGFKEQAEEIGGILTVIDEVAEDTRLLSLNAAIIAVQAREEGRGFAVVASGIRELAEQARTSIVNVSDLVRAVQHQGLGTVEAIREGAETADLGTKAAGEVREKIQEMDMVLHELKSNIMTIGELVDSWEGEIGQMATTLHDFTSRAREMSQVGNKQSQVSTQLVSASEEVRNFGFLIKRTMSELSQGSALIKRVAENIGRMAREFQQMSISRMETTDRIVRGMRDMKMGADANRVRSLEMEKVISFLQIQADKLKIEVDRFIW